MAGPDDERLAGAVPVQGCCEQDLLLRGRTGNQLLELRVEHDGRGVGGVFRVWALSPGQHGYFLPAFKCYEISI